MPVKAPVGDHPLRQTFIQMIQWADAHRGRSLQTTIGPSELGVACMRRLAYSLDKAPTSNWTSDPWFAIIGTAVHSWLGEAINDYQRDVLGRDPLRNPRWLVEQQVWTGDPNCPSGHSDVYDLDEETVIDWKIVGPTTLGDVKKNGPKPYYRVQGHTYGKGWRRAGRNVKRVMIVYLPRNAPLNQTHVWHEEFDESIADRALARLATIAAIRKTLPTPAIPSADGCTWCPYFRPHKPTDSQGCIGHER